MAHHCPPASLQQCHTALLAFAQPLAFQHLDLLCPLPMHLAHDAGDGCWVMVLWSRWTGPNSGESAESGKNAAFAVVGCFGLPKNLKHFVVEVPKWWDGAECLAEHFVGFAWQPAVGIVAVDCWCCHGWKLLPALLMMIHTRWKLLGAWIRWLSVMKKIIESSKKKQYLENKII